MAATNYTGRLAALMDDASLILQAIKLQDVVIALRGRDESVEIEEAFSSAQAALNVLILDILKRHMKDVSLRYDPRRPARWDDHLAVLEISLSRYVLRVPIPKLRLMDIDIANAVCTNLSRPDKGFGYVYRVEMLKRTHVGVVTDNCTCHCGCVAADHERIRVDYIVYFNAGSAEYPTQGQHSKFRFETPCKCGCKNFVVNWS